MVDAEDAYDAALIEWAWMHEEEIGTEPWRERLDDGLHWLHVAAAQDHPEALGDLAYLALVTSRPPASPLARQLAMLTLGNRARRARWATTSSPTSRLRWRTASAQVRRGRTWASPSSGSCTPSASACRATKPR